MIEAKAVEEYLIVKDDHTYKLDPNKDIHTAVLEDVLEQEALSNARHNINNQLGSLTFAQILPNKVEIMNKEVYNTLLESQKTFTAYLKECSIEKTTYDNFVKGIQPHLEELEQKVTLWMTTEKEHLFQEPYRDQFTKIVTAYIGILTAITSLSDQSMNIKYNKNRLILKKENDNYTLAD